MSPAVIFVTGRDPQMRQVCSHTSYVRTHARAALRAGYEAHLVCLAPQDRSELTDYGTVRATATGAATVRQNMIPRHSPPLSRAIVGLVRSLGRRQVILHGFGVWGHASTHANAVLAREGRRCATLLSSYTTYLDESESQWRGLCAADGPEAYARFALEQAWIRAVVFGYERRAYRGSDRVLLNYRAVDRLVAARFGGDVRREIIPYTIEQALMGGGPAPAPPRDPSRPPNIVCVASHDPRKGVDVLLRALARLRGADVRFRAQLVGDGALLEAHRRLTQALQLGDCVEIVGRAPSIDDYLADADIFVLPSREEQSGSLALIEAMQAGVACVASGCDGIPEDVRHGEDGWLVTPGDVNSMAEGIGALVANPGLRTSLARAGRLVFETRFSAAGLIDALDATYRDALAQLPAAA